MSICTLLSFLFLHVSSFWSDDEFFCDPRLSVGKLVTISRCRPSQDADCFAEASCSEYALESAPHFLHWKACYGTSRLVYTLRRCCSSSQCSDTCFCLQAHRGETVGIMGVDTWVRGGYIASNSHGEKTFWSLIQCINLQVRDEICVYQECRFRYLIQPWNMCWVRVAPCRRLSGFCSRSMSNNPSICTIWVIILVIEEEMLNLIYRSYS